MTTKVAYFDTFSGISGDMTIGALLDLGMPLDALERGLAPLGLEGVELSLDHRVRSGIRATKFRVHTPESETAHTNHDPQERHDHNHDHQHAHDHGHQHAHDHNHEDAHDHNHEDGRDHNHDHQHGHRTYREIKKLLAAGGLTPSVRERAEKVFHALAVAEAKIHACPIEDIGFHEVGALDAIVDIVGTAIGLEYLGIEEIYVSELPLGSGLTRSQHGVIPVPAPATVEILRGLPCRFDDGAAELVTPTGAAILGALASPGSPPALTPIRSGYGAGDRELADRPNLLRVVLAEKESPQEARPGPGNPGNLEHDEMVVLEANVDDMNPEFFEPAMESLFAAGARDVSLQALTMKRGRPATLIRVIGLPSEKDRLSQVLLQETSTIGVRAYPVSRVTLPRRNTTVSTPYGAINVKLVDLPGGGERATPEYGDCHRVAREHGLPVGVVYEEALKAAWKRD